VVIVVVREPGLRMSARSMACGVVAVCLAAFAAGCTTSNTSNASLATSAEATGPTIAFDSIDGPPVGVFNRLVDNISTEAQARQIAIASREGAASYRVRGYLAAQVIRGQTHISWVWDVYDDDKLRTLRITGEEPGVRSGGDPWAAADEPMLRKIARTSMDRLAAHLRNPGVPAGAGGMAVAETEAVQTAPARSAARPSAAERLSLSAVR
jgi:hypothetical protein